MTVDYTKLKVDDIKHMLVSEGRFTPTEIDKLDVKGKSAWVALHSGEPEEEEEEDLVWDGVEDLMDGVAPAKPVQDERTVNIPHYSSVEWNDYVISQFDKKELIDGKYPSINGLRRLVDLLLGEVVFSGPIKVEQTMDPEHTGKAVVVYKLVIAWKLDAFYDGYVTQEGYPERTFTSVASSWHGNTAELFSVFPECIADTRAEARTLRRALRLNVVSYDELPQTDVKAILAKQKQKTPETTTGDWEEDDLISDAQINTIQTMCKRLDIDVQKFINSGKSKYDNINEVTRKGAAGMMKQLNRYQSTGDDAIEIPLNLRSE